MGKSFVGMHKEKKEKYKKILVYTKRKSGIRRKNGTKTHYLKWFKNLRKKARREGKRMT